MEILNILNKRYSTKKFNSDKKLTEDQLSQLEEILRLCPSSTNLQPWYFTIVTSKEGKEKIAKATGGDFSFNTDKILDSSAVIIFSCRTELNDEYLQRLTDIEDKDGRFTSEDIKNRTHQVRSMFAYIHRDTLKDFEQWTAKQLYINLGNFTLSAAALDLDTLIMEGFDTKLIDKEFNLNEKGFSSCVLVAVGYSTEDDFNKKLPKSRLPKEDIIERV